MARIRREQAPALREGRSAMLDILMSVHQDWIAKMVSGEKTGELLYVNGYGRQRIYRRRNNGTNGTDFLEDF